jgi:hypothetical protein
MIENCFPYFEIWSNQIILVRRNHDHFKPDLSSPGGGAQPGGLREVPTPPA